MTSNQSPLTQSSSSKVLDSRETKCSAQTESLTKEVETHSPIKQTRVSVWNLELWILQNRIPDCTNSSYLTCRSAGAWQGDMLHQRMSGESPCIRWQERNIHQSVWCSSGVLKCVNLSKANWYNFRLAFRNFWPPGKFLLGKWRPGYTTFIAKLDGFVLPPWASRT